MRAAAGAPAESLRAWTPIVTRALVSEVHLALFALEVLPPDPVVIEPVIATWPSPEAMRSVNDTAIKVLARVADARCGPWLAGALNANWRHWRAAFEGFRHAKDPAAIPIMKAWLAKKGTAERHELGGAILAELERH